MFPEHFETGLKTALRSTKDAPVLLEVRGGRFFIGTHEGDMHTVVFSFPTEMENFRFVMENAVAKQINVGKTLEIQVEDGKMRIETGGTKFTLNNYDSEITLSGLARQYTGEQPIVVGTDLLQRAVKIVEHSSNSRELVDVVMVGFHMAVVDSGVELMATAGKTISMTQIPALEKPDNLTLILNPMFNRIASLLIAESTSIGFNDRALSLRCQDDNGARLDVVSALVNGKPLPYSDIINNVENSVQSTFRINRKEFLEAAKKVKFFTEESKKYLTSVTIENNTLSLYADNAFGEAKATIACEGEGEIRFNTGTDTLLSYLTSSTAEVVAMGVNSSTSPLIFDDETSKEVIVTLTA